MVIQNLQQYFTSDQQFFLHNINYKMIENTKKLEEYQLKCTDNIQVYINDQNVRVIFTRMLNFEPENLFGLSISFGAILVFVEGKKDTFNWEEINLAEEFKKQGDFVLNNLASRASLQISQITSAMGQIPLITPPTVAGK